MRRRLGLAISYDGPDTHGHYRINDNRGARWQTRHTTMLKAWRQVFSEAGGLIPDRNIEKLLRNTHIPVPPGDNRRMDIVVHCLNVARGLPLFCDATVVSPITRTGQPRPGTSNKNGKLLEDAERENNDTYWEVENSGLGALYSLGAETYGRWSKQCVDLVPALAQERGQSVHSRIRRGVIQGLLQRWWGILGVALQRAVAHSVLHETADLPIVHAEPSYALAVPDLQLV